MTEKQFVTRLALINLTILILTCSLNYWIDGLSLHHLPDETNYFSRGANNSALSKQYYLTKVKPDTIYFGSSRVQVGLPARPDLVGGQEVYNAGLVGASLGQWAPFASHFLNIAEPKRIVIGIDFFSFSTKQGTSELDLSMLEPRYIVYLAKLIAVNLGQSLSLPETYHSIKAMTGAYKGEETKFNFGQTTAALMKKADDSGKAVNEFKKRLKLTFIKPSEDVADDKAWFMFDDLVAESCQKNIKTRIYIHPTHALTVESIRQNGTWLQFEQWKMDLANLATRYHHQKCDIKIFDFSGYNAITTETIQGLSPTTSLRYYWEASHYKSNVGELILNRLFSTTANGIPKDFGRELRQDTVDDVLSAIREEQSHYLVSHAEDIKTANKWLSEKEQGNFLSDAESDISH